MSDRLLTDEELRAIAERAAQATPGPWIADVRVGVVNVFAGQPPECLTAACPRSLFHKQGRWTPEGWAVNQEDVQDAAFIAASREDVPRLIADLHRYQEFCRRLLACYDGEGDVLALVEEVRAALEGK